MMKTPTIFVTAAILLAISTFGLKAHSNDCPKLLNEGRGRIIGYSYPDGDPIYENLGERVSHTLDGDPIYQKTGATYGHHKGLGNVTGFSGPDGDPLYDGETSAHYTLDGDRITPLNRKKFDPYDP
jgi:hypothetical protein